MEVIAHHDKSMQFPAGIVTGFEEGFFKRLTRSFALEYPTAVIAAVGDVIESSGIGKAQLAGHAPKRSNEMGNSQESRNDPLAPAPFSFLDDWKGIFEKSWKLKDPNGYMEKDMSLKIGWIQGPAYPALIKGPAAGIVDGRFLVAGGMSYPWREVEYGFWLGIDEEIEAIPSLVVPGEQIESPIGKWHPLPPLPIGPGWTSGAAVAGGLAVVGGRRRAVGMRATSDVWLLDVGGGKTTWERLADRPAPARVATTFADGDLLYTAFGTDWQPHEHATEDPNIYRMDVRKRSGWEVVSQFPGKPRWFPGVTICNGKLYVISGRDQPVGGVKDVQPYNAHRVDADGATVYVAFREVWECDLETGAWQELARPPRAFACEAFTVADRWR